MNFDEIVVKESPGLCRCCLSEGCYKDLSTEYTWMNDTEVYADMLLECFDISISQHNDGPNGGNRLICEVCITRLRDACNFKKQVLDSEKKFVDLLARGEFQPKVIMYQAPMKSEQLLEESVVEDAEVEYLDESMDYDDDLPLKQPAESAETYDGDAVINVREVKVKRGRPKKSTAVVKTVKTEKKKAVKKPATAKKPLNKGRIKEENENYLERLCSMRRNIQLILHYGTVVPFQWYTKGLRCFYCQKVMRDSDSLKEHTQLKHANVNLDAFIPQRIISKDIPIKADVSHISCKICSEELPNLDRLTHHINEVHNENYDDSVGVCVFPFFLTKDIMPCCLCEYQYDNITSLVTHMYKEHITHSSICQICGLSFINKVRLQRHITKSHIGHKCSLCQRVFDAFHKLEKHKQRIHGLVKMHECNLCNETFESGYQVKVHMGNAHNVAKYRIKCEQCPKITTTKGAMVLHVQSVHSQVRYACDLCEYKCGIKWMIKLHKRKHYGEKDYVCSVCKRKFGRSSNVRAHMKVHTGNVGRVCRTCKQGFTDLETLNRHVTETHYYHEYV